MIKYYVIAILFLSQLSSFAAKPAYVTHQLFLNQEYTERIIEGKGGNTYVCTHFRDSITVVQNGQKKLFKTTKEKRDGLCFQKLNDENNPVWTVLVQGGTLKDMLIDENENLYLGLLQYGWVTDVVDSKGGIKTTNTERSNTSILIKISKEGELQYLKTLDAAMIGIQKYNDRIYMVGNDVRGITGVKNMHASFSAQFDINSGERIALKARTFPNGVKHFRMDNKGNIFLIGNCRSSIEYQGVAYKSKSKRSSFVLSLDTNFKLVHGFVMKGGGEIEITNCLLLKERIYIYGIANGTVQFNPSDKKSKKDLIHGSFVVCYNRGLEKQWYSVFNNSTITSLAVDEISGEVAMAIYVNKYDSYPVTQFGIEDTYINGKLELPSWDLHYTSIVFLNTIGIPTKEYVLGTTKAIYTVSVEWEANKKLNVGCLFSGEAKDINVPNWPYQEYTDNSILVQLISE